MDAWYQPHCEGTENQRIISMTDYIMIHNTFLNHFSKRVVSFAAV